MLMPNTLCVSGLEADKIGKKQKNLLPRMMRAGITWQEKTVASLMHCL
jgi:hypothetical protein